MTTIRFTENQIVECGYDFSDLEKGVLLKCYVRHRTYWDSDADQLITELTIERYDTGT